MKVIDILKSQVESKYANCRNGAYTGDYAMKGKSVIVQRILRVQLWLCEAVILGFAVVAQPLIRFLGGIFTAPERPEDLLLTAGWVSVLFMAFLLAALIYALVVAPTERISNDVEYKHFMKTEAAVFVVMSVGLQLFDWLPVYWPWAERAVNLTTVLCMMAATVIAVGGVGTILCTVLIYLYGLTAPFLQKHRKQKPVVLALPCSCETEECQMTVPQETEESRVGHLRIIGEVPKNWARHEKN